MPIRPSEPPTAVLNDPLKGIHVKYATSFIFWLFLLAGTAMAQSPTGGVPIILAPNNGETVASPVMIRIGASEGSIKAADRSADQQGAHLHLVIDAPLPEAGKMIPMDSHHIHLMHGETQKTTPLSVEKHTIQLIEGRRQVLTKIPEGPFPPVRF